MQYLFDVCVCVVIRLNVIYVLVSNYYGHYKKYLKRKTSNGFKFILFTMFVYDNSVQELTNEFIRSTR